MLSEGKIKYTDFLMATINFKLVVDEEHFWNAFCFFDYNNDGFITASDLKNAFERANCEVTSQELDEIFENFDVNFDKQIDFDEFKAMLNCFVEMPATVKDNSPVQVVRCTRPQRRTYKRKSSEAEEQTNFSLGERAKAF